MVNLLNIRYQSLCKSAEQDIRGQLQELLTGLDRALFALEKGQSIDEHLLTNVAHVTASIGKRNALLELKPLIEEK